MPKSKAKAKAKATSKSSIHNIIKIVLDQKKKRKTRRRTNRARRTREQDQMELLATLASKPSMREVKQPDPKAEQNELIKNALLASNVGVIRALNNLNQPTFSTGYAPPQFPEAVETISTQTGDVLTIEDMLKGLTPKKLERVYNDLFKENRKFTNYKSGTIIKEIKSRSPNLIDLENVVNRIHLTDNEPNITSRSGGGGGGRQTSLLEFPSQFYSMPPLQEEDELE